MINLQISDLSARLAAKLNEGSAARESLSSEVAFGWSTGLPPVLARFVATDRIDGLTFPFVRVKASATPAKKVAEGGTKPTAVTLTSGTLALAKFSGLAEFTLERFLSSTALLPAIQSTIAGQALVAYDAECVAALAADAGGTATGATWTGAILGGIAKVASNGHNPDVLVMAPSDYASAVENPGSAFTMDPASGIASLFGLQLAVVVGATAGTAYVLDSRAATAVENVASPLVILDPFSKADTNTIRLVAEVVAGVVVTQPAGVAKITVTPAKTGGTTNPAPPAGATRDDYAQGA